MGGGGGVHRACSAVLEHFVARVQSTSMPLSPPITLFGFSRGEPPALTAGERNASIRVRVGDAPRVRYVRRREGR